MKIDSEVFFSIRLLRRWQARCQSHIYWWNWNKRWWV